METKKPTTKSSTPDRESSRGESTMDILAEATRRVRARPAWMLIGSNNTWRDKHLHGV
jgi:hypothetical protein